MTHNIQVCLVEGKKTMKLRIIISNLKFKMKNTLETHLGVWTVGSPLIQIRYYGQQPDI